MVRMHENHSHIRIICKQMLPKIMQNGLIMHYTGRTVAGKYGVVSIPETIYAH